jgi:hypothetical protein
MGEGNASPTRTAELRERRTAQLYFKSFQRERERESPLGLGQDVALHCQGFPAGKSSNLKDLKDLRGSEIDGAIEPVIYGGRDGVTGTP